MSRPVPSFAALWLIGFALLGCTRTVPVAVGPVACPVTAEILARHCEAPRPLAAGATFGDVLLASELDRKALADCAAHDRLLSDIITKCQQVLRDYNARLDELGSQPAGKPWSFYNPLHR